jgi:hypothetical protein
MTLIDNKDTITPGIISKEVDIYQPLMLNTQSGFFIRFSDDYFLGVFLASSAYGGRSRGLLFHLQGKTLVPSLEELLIPPGMDIED